MVQTNALFNMVLMGKSGAGKSASGNTILRRPAFMSKRSPKSVTREITVESGIVDGIPVNVYDTPGFCDTKVKENDVHLQLQDIFQKCESGPCVFLLVIKADRFTEEERKTVEKIEEFLGKHRLEKTWILFTGGDQLSDENMTIQEFINESEPLKTLVNKYNQRYQVFNNKKKKFIDQVKMLITNLLKTCLKTLGEAATKLRETVKTKGSKKVEPDTSVSSHSSTRIVLLGKSGFGKSASGNTILGEKVFESEQSINSVTKESLEKHADVSGRSVSVVDTPGLFDTNMKYEELVTEIAKSVYISSPGPHAFLIVFRVTDRFTEQEQQIADQVESQFGEGVLKYSIILFTHGDQLEEKSVEKLIEENCALRHLVQKCGGRYHVFNNKDENNREQVNDLLQKIDTMIVQNGGGHYSNQMLEDAERLRRQNTKSSSSKLKTVVMSAWNGFQQFISKYQHFFYIAAFAVGGALSGAALGALGGVALGALLGTGAVGGAVNGAIGGAVVGAIGGAIGGDVKMPAELSLMEH